MSKSAFGFLAAIFLLAGCGGRELTREELDDAKVRVEAAMAAAAQARAALELLGILPTYTCGEPRATFIEAAGEQARVDFACVTATTEAIDATADGVRLNFSEAGCEIGWRKVTGAALFRYSGGEDRMELEADFRETLIGTTPLQAKAGYGTCGDEKRYWVLAEGVLPKRPDRTFKVDGRVAKRDGIPVIGSTSLILEGPGEVQHESGIDRATFFELLYEIGEYLPKEGSLLIETSSGHVVKATFKNHLWRLGEAEITVDDSEPKRVPIIQ